MNGVLLIILQFLGYVAMSIFSKFPLLYIGYFCKFRDDLEIVCG